MTARQDHDGHRQDHNGHRRDHNRHVEMTMAEMTMGPPSGGKIYYAWQGLKGPEIE